MAWEIQVCEGGRWLGWDKCGGGDRILFGTADAARDAALATGECAPDDEGVSWRIEQVDELPNDVAPYFLTQEALLGRSARLQREGWAAGALVYERDGGYSLFHYRGAECVRLRWFA